ncbi:trap transporter, 4tm/12tm fusion protein [Ruegeria sp. TrichCH4B]|nr:trap transporter, 4tm/12tm fusion protein [Ruegeria sp. TrichCH4B]
MRTPISQTLAKQTILTLAVLFSLYHLYFGYYPAPGAMNFRLTHVCLALMLCYLLLPAREAVASVVGRRLDVATRILAVGLSAAILIYVIRDSDAFQMQTGYLSESDVIMGTVLIVLVLEATRRAVGMAMTLLAVLLMTHALISGALPGMLGGTSVSWTAFVDTNFVQTSGLLGIPVSVTAGYVVLFLFFGTLLLKTGVGKLLMDLATAATGRYSGGPAKAAVVSSACTGTISGSVIANVVTTGAVTIPLMKRSGYKPEIAAAIEASSSTGGVIMPPVMGAAAFILALFAGVPYREVMLAAAIPSALYFWSIFVTVHLEAKKGNIGALPESEIPRLWPLLRSRGYMLLPIIAITAILIIGYTPTVAAFYGCVSTIALSYVRRETRLTFTGFIECLEETARASVPVVMACATAGIIVGSVMMSGVGLRISSLILELSHGSLLPSLLLTAIAAIILGMGMTTTAVYVTLAALIIPGLERTGVEPLAAHMFVLYFGVVSYVTPPVALGAFAAAGVARTKPGRTALTAFRVAAAGFIVPFMFVYGPELLLIGSPGAIMLAVATAILGVTCLSAALCGWMVQSLHWVERIALLGAAILLMFTGWSTDLLGLLLLFSVVALQKYRARPDPEQSV